MSVTTAELRIDATQATQALNRIQKQVDGLGTAFSRLRNVVGTLALGNLVQNAFRLADSIDDVAKATGLATSTVIGFGQAIAQNGGTVADAQTALTKLSQTISEAQNGNKNAITSFNELGISLGDLATLSDEQILNKVVSQLGQIKDKGDQARLSADLLGKSIRGVDFSGVSQDIGSATQNSLRYAESTKAAADANQNIGNAINVLQQELLRALKPLNEIIGNVNTASKEFKTFIATLIEVAQILAVVFAVLRGFSLLIAFIKNWKEAIAVVKTFGITLRDAINPKNWNFIGQMTEKIKKTIKNYSDEIKRAKKEGVAKEHIEDLEKELKITKDLLNGWTYVTDKVKKFAAALGIAGLFAYKLNENLDTIEKTERKRTAGRPGGGRGSPDTDAQVAQYKELLKAYEDSKAKVDSYTKSLNKELTAITDNLNVQKEAIQIGEKLAQVRETERQITEKIADAVQRYEEMKQGLDPKNENDRKLIGYINAQIAAIKGKEAATLAAGRTAVIELQKEQDQYNQITKEIDAYKKMLEDNLALQNMRNELELIGLIGIERDKAADKLRINADLQKRLNDLLAEEIELSTRFNQLSAEGQDAERSAYEKSMADIKKRRAAAEQLAKDETEITNQKYQKQEEIQNNGLKGFQDRLKELKENLTNYDIGAAFADSIIRAVETGKFHLKTFLLEMIQMWIQQKAKLAAVDLFGKFISPVVSAAGGAIGSFIGKLFGLANGGPANANQPYIVGERGPELFVPNSAGTVVPNNKLGGGGPVNAPVTNNYITNNINAVDAKSVAQLFTENRKTLLGATMMAQKEMPYAGRM